MITSTKNDLVKYIDKLIKSSRFRSEEDVYIIEGIRMVSEVSGDRLVKLIISETYESRNMDKVLELVKGRPYEQVSDVVYRHMSDTENPQGIMAVVRQQHYKLEELLVKEPLLVILENIQNPGNLGTIIRSAEAAGATGIIMSSNCADIYNNKVIRGSMGSIFRMPYYVTDDLPALIAKLRDKYHIDCYAAALSGSVDYAAPDYRNPCAFVIGNEGNGLTEETIQASSGAVRIPMEGNAESLNAGIAASIFLYEAHRQRHI